MLQEQTNPREERRRFDIVEELYDWASSLSWAICVIVVVFAFGFCVFGVDGESMENTLHNGDMMLLQRGFFTPKPGDIVVFSKATLPEYHFYDELNHREKSLVKRVIALGGDIIDYDARTGLTVNGVPIDEPYIKERMSWFAQTHPIELPFAVPQGEVFVCGDNRNNSWDSRSADIGTIDERYLIGKCVLRLMPLNKFGNPNKVSS